MSARLSVKTATRSSSQACGKPSAKLAGEMIGHVFSGTLVRFDTAFTARAPARVLSREQDIGAALLLAHAVRRRAQISLKKRYYALIDCSSASRVFESARDGPS